MFITFEGGEGVGKTTQANLLLSWMSENGYFNRCCLTKEPGEPTIQVCNEIRHILLDERSDVCPSAELLLFLADRAQHVEKFIKPKLKKGMQVICDRFTDSTKAYQSARGLEDIDWLIDFASRGLVPDLTFFLDCPVDVALQRARSANEEYSSGDRIEKETLAFHMKVRENFLKIAENEKRIIVINAYPDRLIKDVHKEIISIVSKKISEWR